MRAGAALALVLAAACKEQGPAPAQLEAARKKQCSEAAPRVRAKWEQAQAADALAKTLPPAKADEPARRAVRLRELHSDGTADSSFTASGKPGVLAGCVAELAACESERLDELFQGCAAVDAYVVVRPRVLELPKVNEAMLNKYTPGHVTGDAIAFGLGADAGTPERLGVVAFDLKLRGGVDVERDATTEERERALGEALRKQVLQEIEERLSGGRPSAPDAAPLVPSP